MDNIPQTDIVPADDKPRAKARKASAPLPMLAKGPDVGQALVLLHKAALMGEAEHVKTYETAMRGMRSMAETIRIAIKVLQSK